MGVCMLHKFSTMCAVKNDVFFVCSFFNTLNKGKNIFVLLIFCCTFAFCPNTSVEQEQN